MEEIINSVMQSPENTNPNVLRSQLQKMGGGVVYAMFSKEGSTESEQTWVCDKTFEELKAAYDAGSLIFAITDYAPGRAALMTYESSFNFHTQSVVEEFIAEIITVNIEIGAINALKAYRFMIDNDYGVRVGEAEKSFTDSSGDEQPIIDHGDHGKLP